MTKKAQGYVLRALMNKYDKNFQMEASQMADEMFPCAMLKG